MHTWLVSICCHFSSILTVLFLLIHITKTILNTKPTGWYWFSFLWHSARLKLTLQGPQISREILQTTHISCQSMQHLRKLGNIQNMLRFLQHPALFICYNCSGCSFSLYNWIYKTTKIQTINDNTHNINNHHIWIASLGCDFKCTVGAQNNHRLCSKYCKIYNNKTIGASNDSKSYPVLMAIISIRGLRRILGKLRSAPPVLCPSTFFVPRKHTELPVVNTKSSHFTQNLYFLCKCFTSIYIP